MFADFPQQRFLNQDNHQTWSRFLDIAADQRKPLTDLIRLSSACSLPPPVGSLVDLVRALMPDGFTAADRPAIASCSRIAPTATERHAQQHAITIRDMSSELWTEELKVTERSEAVPMVGWICDSMSLMRP